MYVTGGTTINELRCKYEDFNGNFNFHSIKVENFGITQYLKNWILVSFIHYINMGESLIMMNKSEKKLFDSFYNLSYGIQQDVEASLRFRWAHLLK